MLFIVIVTWLQEIGESGSGYLVVVSSNLGSCKKKKKKKKKSSVELTDKWNLKNRFNLEK